MKGKLVLAAAAAVCIVCLNGCSVAGQAADREDATVVLTNSAAGAEDGAGSVEEAAGVQERQSEEIQMQGPDSDGETEGEDEGGTETEETGEEAAGKTETEPFLVKNPGWDYYYEGGEGPSNPQTLTLVKASENANQITDQAAWFARNGLADPSFPYEDDTYRYEAYGDNGFYVYMLRLYEKETGELAANLDFSDYRYAGDAAQEDLDFVEQRICYAKAEDGVLYVATAHNTYAASSPHTAYVTAIDLEDFHVIWKTAPLTCNASSFVVFHDALICGYGFTDEDDFLNVIDRGTGKIWEQIPIKSKADYIIWKDDTLYVRTYHTDYTFWVAVGDEKQK